MNETIRIARRLARRTADLRCGPPVTHVYAPLVYARRSVELYLERYARPGCEALLVGMNPGPWGMVQTGVPFGDVVLVRDWLGIESTVDVPAAEHPKRPILGFGCGRGEVSGRRLWGWARERFGTPERFFARFFVWNYCPLAFLEASGRNRTPDKLPAHESAPLFAACDEALRAMAAALEPTVVVGIGGFAEERARRTFAGETRRVGGMLHPSPASPRANRGWAEEAERQLRALGIELPPRRAPAARRR